MKHAKVDQFVKAAAGITQDDLVAWLKDKFARGGFTQAGLAKAIGVDPARITEIIQGQRLVKVSELAAFADYFNEGALGERITRLMNAKELGPIELANKAGLKRDAVRDILRGKSKDPSISTMLKLAKALDCTIDELMGES